MRNSVVIVLSILSFCIRLHTTVPSIRFVTFMLDIMSNNVGKKSKWNLSVYITNLSTEKSVEVNGETHVGKLMLDLVEGLGKCSRVL